MHRDLEPKGETLQQAIRWISAEREAQPQRAMTEIVNEAGPRFDLAPIETEYLWKTFVVNRAKE